MHQWYLSYGGEQLGPFDQIEVSLMTGDLVIDAATSVLLGVVNPFAIVIPFVSTGTGGVNPCLEAIVSQEVMTPSRLCLW